MSVDPVVLAAIQGLVDQLKPKTVPGWNPQPKQQRARDLVARVLELLYGGAAGGGKSYFIRCDAVEFALNHAGAHIGIVRRTLPMLKQSHEIGLNEITHGLAKHNRVENTWTFENGSVIRFISLQHEGDEQNYKSVEFDRLYFDEVTELSETQYTYMLSRLRSKNGYKVAAICCSNPEGVGFAWVRRRFVAPRADDLLADQPMPKEYEPWAPPLHNGQPGPLRVYVPASVYDNPALLAANPDYIQQLEAIPDARKRAALLHGDWNAMDQLEGALWNFEVIENHRVASIPTNVDVIRKVVAIDPAVTSGPNSDETGIQLVVKGMQELTENGKKKRIAHFYVLEDASMRAPGPDWAKRAVQLAYDHKADLLYESDQGGDAIKELLIQAAKDLGLPRPTILSVRAANEGSKATRAQPVVGLYLQGYVHHVGYHGALEEQMTTWIPELTKKSPDRVDSLVYAVRHLSKPVSVPVKARALS